MPSINKATQDMNDVNNIIFGIKVHFWNIFWDMYMCIVTVNKTETKKKYLDIVQ